MPSSFNLPGKDRIAVLRAWQVAFCDGDHCAAMLMNHLDYWHSWKVLQRKESKSLNDIAESLGQTRSHNEKLFQYHKLEMFQQALMGLFGRTTIHAALKLLEEKGVLSKHRNPRPHRGSIDNTLLYLFHPEPASEFLITYTSAEDNIERRLLSKKADQEKDRFSPELNLNLYSPELDDTNSNLGDKDLTTSKTPFISSKSERMASKSEFVSSNSGRTLYKTTTKTTDKEVTAAKDVIPKNSFSNIGRACQNDFVVSHSCSENDHKEVTTPVTHTFAAAVLSGNDLIIKDRLTPVQVQYVQAAFVELSDKFTGYSELQVIADIEATVLDPTCFTKTGRVFSHKLNAIKLCISRGQWSPSASTVLFKEKRGQEQREALDKKIQEMNYTIEHADRMLSHLPASTSAKLLSHWKHEKQRAEEVREVLLAERIALKTKQFTQSSFNQTEGKTHHG